MSYKNQYSQPNFGSGLLYSDRISKYRTTDPWRHIPFEETNSHNTISPREWVLYFILLISLISGVIVFYTIK